MDDHLVHTIPNHHPTKMDVLPKTFVQIILAAKWLVRHSSIRPPNNSDNLSLLFCLYPSSMADLGWNLQYLLLTYADSYLLQLQLLYGLLVNNIREEDAPYIVEATSCSLAAATCLLTAATCMLTSVTCLSAAATCLLTASTCLLVAAAFLQTAIFIEEDNNSCYTVPVSMKLL